MARPLVRDTVRAEPMRAFASLGVIALAACQPHPAPEINFAPGTSITVAQNYQAAYAKALEFAQSCYRDPETHAVNAQLDTDRRLGEITVALKSSQGPSPVLAVSIAYRDDRSSSITSRYFDTAWASHGRSFEAASMGASAACQGSPF